MAAGPIVHCRILRHGKCAKDNGKGKGQDQADAKRACPLAHTQVGHNANGRGYILAGGRGTAPHASGGTCLGQQRSGLPARRLKARFGARLDHVWPMPGIVTGRVVFPSVVRSGEDGDRVDNARTGNGWNPLVPVCASITALAKARPGCVVGWNRLIPSRASITARPKAGKAAQRVVSGAVRTGKGSDRDEKARVDKGHNHRSANSRGVILAGGPPRGRR